MNEQKPPDANDYLTEARVHLSLGADYLRSALDSVSQDGKAGLLIKELIARIDRSVVWIGDDEGGDGVDMDPRVHLQDALEHLRGALAVTSPTLLAAREIEEAIDHAELAISDLDDDGGTVEDVEEEDGPRPCSDCGGFGHGPDTMQGGEHANGACPTCNGSGLATPFEDCGPGWEPPPAIFVPCKKDGGDL